MTKQKYAAYALRTVNKDGEAYGDFQWPKKGKVICPDWKPIQECGNGLHGLLHGQGSTDYLDFSDDALWQVVGLNDDELKQTIDLEDKVKFPSCTVVFTGTRQDAVAYIQKNDPLASLCVFGTATAGNGGTATAGYWGTATAGDYGTATAGDRGTATAGDWGTLIIRYWDAESNRYRFNIAYVGENGINADTPYRLDENHKFVETHP